MLGQGSLFRPESWDGPTKGSVTIVQVLRPCGGVRCLATLKVVHPRLAAKRIRRYFVELIVIREETPPEGDACIVVLFDEPVTHGRALLHEGV